MKESKTLFICAVMKLTADVMKIIVNIGDIYPVKVGWATSLILSIASVWLIANSKVKHKPILAVAGEVIFIAVVVILATMSVFGLVESP
jgi:hypothetical protein